MRTSSSVISSILHNSLHIPFAMSNSSRTLLGVSYAEQYKVLVCTNENHKNTSSSPGSCGEQVQNLPVFHERFKVKSTMFYYLTYTFC